MVKAFDDREKELICNNLLEKGRGLFARYGLKKTSIKNLTDAVGIAQGSFYKFFDSKEELYFTILEREEEILKNELLSVFFQTDKEKESFRQMLKQGLIAAAENPFLKQIFLEEEYELLIRRLPQEKIDAHQQRDTDALLPLITLWQSEGKMITQDPQLISGIIRAIFLLTLHKKEIGEKYFAAIMDLLIDLITDGLFTGKE